MESLRTKCNIMNLCYWIMYGGEMAKECPLHGWVDVDFDNCDTCGFCARSKK